MNFCLKCATPELFVTSQWQGDSKKSSKYSIFRWILAIYFNFVLLLSIFSAEDLKLYGIYLTNWNVVMNASSSLMGAVLVSLYCNRTITFKDKRDGMSKILKVYWLLSAISPPLCLSVTCLYWTLIYNEHDTGLNNSLTHAGNAIVLIIDVCVNAHPPRYGLFIYPMIVGASYGFVFNCLYTILGGTNENSENFVYSILDWNKNAVSAFMMSSVATVLVSTLHLGFTFIAKVRIYLHKKLKASTRKSSQNQDSIDLEHHFVNLLDTN